LVAVMTTPVASTGFQSPSRWGRCCFNRSGLGTPEAHQFQSPSRWGRCCFHFRRHVKGLNALRFSPLLDGDGVAFLCTAFKALVASGFSPLLDGDGVALRSTAFFAIIAILFQSPSRWGRCCFAYITNLFTPGTISFSPLLDGDGVALIDENLLGRRPMLRRFSPLLDGDGVALLRRLRFRRCKLPRFSPLLDGDGVAFSRSTVITENVIQFQSPSRWGRCCFSTQVPDLLNRSRRFSPLLDGDGVAFQQPFYRPHVFRDVSVPFSMGTVLLSNRARWSRDPRRWRFSPLLDGDGVALITGSTGVGTVPVFQSPSRWGRCCFYVFGLLGHPGLDVSVPFSMGTVLLFPRRLRRPTRVSAVSVPFSMGTVLLCLSRSRRK